MTTDESATPESIEAEIARKRADMDQTLTALQDKLSPGPIVDQAVGLLKQGPAEIADGFGRFIRENPVAVALIGSGLVWMAVSALRPDRPAWVEHGNPYGGLSDSGNPPEATSGDTGSASSGADLLGQSVDRSEGAATNGWSVAGATKRLGALGHDIADGVRHAPAKAARAARRQARHAGDGARRLWHEQPLAIGAIALAVGAAAAIMLPATRREDALIGPTRDRLRQRAEVFGREQLDRARAAAETAAEDAAAAARNVVAPEPPMAGPPPL